ncbi:MAG TPA: hypothetical protein VGN85_03970 [Methyloceanibacter sp.]|nr:hypothetical protein [Methyloceanibacter sp.]
MSKRSATHATFVIASRLRPRACSTPLPIVPPRHFEGPAEWEKKRHEFDFRVGGR